MTTTSRYSTLMAQHIYQRLVDNREPLRLADVYYGDQNLLPRTPAVCVQPGGWLRELAGAPRRIDQTTQVYIIVYHNSIQDTQANELEVGQFAEAVAKFVDDDSPCGGLVIHSFITAFEPGWRTLGTSKYRSTRLTWTGLTRVALNTDP